MRSILLTTSLIIVDPTQLFRHAALKARGHRLEGAIILRSPRSHIWLSACALLTILVVSFALFHIEYAAKVAIAGFIVPDGGLVRVFSPQPGILQTIHHAKDSRVEAGEALFTISGEQATAAYGGLQQSVIRLLERRVLLLSEARNRGVDRNRNELRSATEAVTQYQSSVDALHRQRQVKRQRAQILSQALERYTDLEDRGFVSREMAQAKRLEHLAEQDQMFGLERELADKKKQLAEALTTLHSLEGKGADQASQTDLLLAEAEREIVETASKMAFSVVAPQSGYVASITAARGDTVGPNRPIAAIVPEGKELYVHLYANSRAVAFARAGMKVSIRLQAYPFQRYGFLTGVVTAVAEAPVAAADLPMQFSLTVDGKSVTSEPIYLVEVHLDRTDFVVDGKAEPLRIGQIVDADLLQERRRLYEWILDPLYQLRKNFLI